MVSLARQVNSRNVMAAYDRLPKAARELINELGPSIMPMLVKHKGKVTEILEEPAMLDELQRFIDGFEWQKDAAKDLEITPQYLVDLMKGRRQISERVAAALGYERRIIYVKKD